MFCTHCGIANVNGALFCKSCGTSMGTAAESGYKGVLPEIDQFLRALPYIWLDNAVTVLIWLVILWAIGGLAYNLSHHHSGIALFYVIAACILWVVGGALYDHYSGR